MDYPEVRSSGGLQYGGDRRAAAAPGPEGRDLSSRLARTDTTSIYKEQPSYALTSLPGSGLLDVLKDPLGIPAALGKFFKEDPTAIPWVMSAAFPGGALGPYAMNSAVKAAGNFLLGDNPTKAALDRAAASTTEENWLEGPWGRREGELTVEDTFAYLDDDRPDNDRREYGGAFGSRVSGNVPAGPGATLTPATPPYPSTLHDHASHFHPPVADVPDVASPNPLTGVRLFRNLDTAQPDNTVTSSEVPVTDAARLREQRRLRLLRLGSAYQPLAPDRRTAMTGFGSIYSA